ncbi:Prophage pi2 protein 38 [gut metagenome]|uniref:Prophage pi2 protein 38 n=1 Tax=gut metagenome TaxID=749906 RepID=J9FVW0_9ZZZZ
MTKDRLDKVLQAFDYPCAWGLFKTPQVPPYVIYDNGNSRNVYSDERILKTIDSFEIELYHNDYAERLKFENYLTQSGIIWQRFVSDTYISSEDVFQSIYEVVR